MSNVLVVRTLPEPHTSPYRFTYSGFITFRIDSPLFKEKRKEWADSNANMGVHLDIDDFINAFMPISPSDNPSDKRKPPQMPDTIVKIIKTARCERTIAEAWAKWLNPARKDSRGPCPGYRLALSQDRWDEGDAEKLKVDGALHLQSQLPPNDGRPHWESQRVLFEFKKGGGSLDPYDDNKKGDGEAETRVDVRGQITSYAANAFGRQHRTAMFLFLINGQKIRATRWDRSGTVFSAAFNYTQRRQTLCKLLWGFSRLSEKKQGIDETAVLLIPDSEDYKAMTFAADLDAEAHKHDISEVEGTIVEGEGPWTFRFVRELFRKSIISGCPRYRLSIPGCEGRPESNFLVGDPVFLAPGMSGRGTRGYVAYDKDNNRFVFLKDAWRPPNEHVDSEGNVLRQLRAANVRNIPTIVCDAELNQETETPRYAAAPDAPEEEDVHMDSSQCGDGAEEGEDGAWVSDNASTSSSHVDIPPSSSAPRTPDSASFFQDEKNTVADDKPPPQGPTPSFFHNRGQHLLRTFRHYRVVVEEVGLDLNAFRSGKQLVSVIRDAVQAHADAVNNAGVIHRDVSVGNILICPTVVLDPKDNKRRLVWKGMLTDWELSKPLPDEGKDESARQPVRTGTWQFTSAYILDNPEEAVRTADDLEAFFNATLYTALRYMRHDCVNLQMTMFDYFDGYKYHSVKQRYMCGLDKQMSMSLGRLHDASKTEYSFLDDNGQPDNHPLNEILAVMLQWFKERYAHLMPSKTKAADVVPQLAIDNHVALLQLLDSKLDDPAPGQTATPWPKNDKVGDQLKPTKKRESQDAKTKKHQTKRLKTNDSGKGGTRASDSSKASGSGATVRAPPLRTRGSRTQRGVGSTRSKRIR